MKKLVLLALFFLINAPASATIWSYSGVSQGIYTADGTLHDISMTIEISDRLWDIDSQQYITPVPGTPLPSPDRYIYNIYDWSIDIAGAEQFNGHAGNHSTGRVWPDGTLSYFDDLILWDENPINSSDEYIILWTSYWTDFDGHPWNYWELCNSPGYGQLAPIMAFGGMGLGEYPSAPFFIELVRNPNPIASEPVPEPSTLLIVGAGLTGYYISRRKRPFPDSPNKAM